MSVKISFRPVQNCSVVRSSHEESNTKKTGLFEVDIAVRGLVLIKDHTESKHRIRRPSHKKVYVSMAVIASNQKSSLQPRNSARLALFWISCLRSLFLFCFW